MIRDVLRMGDPRLLEKARPVEAFDTPELHALLADMRDTMAAPQRRRARRAADRRRAAGGDLRRARQPALSRCRGGARHGAHQSGAGADRRRDGGRLGRLPVGARACADWCRVTRGCAMRGFDEKGGRIDRTVSGFHARRGAARVRPPAAACCTRCASAISRSSVSSTRCSPTATSPRTERAARRYSSAVSRSCSNISTALVLASAGAAHQEHVLRALAERHDLRGVQVEPVLRPARAPMRVQQARAVARGDRQRGGTARVRPGGCSPPAGSGSACSWRETRPRAGAASGACFSSALGELVLDQADHVAVVRRRRRCRAPGSVSSA